MKFKSLGVVDAGLLMLESAATPMHIGGVQVLRRPPGAGKDFMRKLRDYVKGFPVSGAPFNYRFAPRVGTLGLPAWEVVDRVNLEEHVFQHALPWPGGDRELMELISRLNSGPLDRSRPLWEHHLIEGLDGDRYATFTRIHHALMDGKWGMKLAHATTSPSARAHGLPPVWAVKFEGKPAATKPAADKNATRGWWERQSLHLRQHVETFAELRKAFGRIVESFRHPTDGGLVPIYTAPRCMLNGALTPRRELAVVRLDLQRLKDVAHANDATLNEIVLTLCGGALRRYLIEHKALPDRPLIANMPFARARANGDEPGNALLFGLVSLATDIKDPIKRLETVRGSSQHAKELLRDMPSQEAMSIYFGVTALPYLVAQATGNATRLSPQNVVISNVPGPREKRYVNGAEILAEYPLSVLVPGQAMNITVISHAEALDVAVLVCPSLVPDPHRVAEAIVESLGELERAVRVRGKRKAVAAAKGQTRVASKRGESGRGRRARRATTSSNKKQSAGARRSA